ncbi:right-handed parallel beta-helix repeat-containing protein [Pengzhenrongella phosphoraccumulans]|uniref:right-handed parallel beta-helix repeat-containing protein n=1 Tax=Pengzhenrongella phosphoraccumulans TaxID=3114394 RepID=UPI00388FAC00
MKLRTFATACAATALLLSGATAAHATGFGDCPGVSDRGHGHYRLTKDAECDLTLLGAGADVNLAHHTLSSPAVPIEVDGVALHDGKLRTDGIFWLGNHGRMENLDVTALGLDPVPDFYIEAGSDFTVKRSTFHDLSSSVALSFYFGDGGTVSDSSFTRTQTAVSITQNSNVTIRDNRFRSNAIAVNLWNEDLLGLNNTTITRNTITYSSTAGVLVRDGESESPTFDNVRITHNDISRSGGSGIDLTVTCDLSLPCPAGGPPIFVEHNDLSRNGSTPGASSARTAGPTGRDAGLLAHTDADRARAAAARETAPSASTDAGAALKRGGNGNAGLGDYTSSNDGLTARAFLIGGDTDVPTPALLAFVRVAKNSTSKNADRGIDAAGVTDRGGNTSRSNPNPCVGVVCRSDR